MSLQAKGRGLQEEISYKSEEESKLGQAEFQRAMTLGTDFEVATSK